MASESSDIRPKSRRAALRDGLSPLLRRPDWFDRITAKTLRADLVAGLTGATIVLPQGVAFAAIAGLPPQYGFYTAMVTPVVAALAGSSWHAVSGPTTAISALVFAALAPMMTPGSPDFIAAAITLTLLVGIAQFAFGFLKLGGLVDFVSHSVMLGFVAVAAVFIALSQVTHAINVPLPRPEHLGAFLQDLPAALGAIDPISLAIAAVSLAVAIGVRAIRASAPNYLVALAAGTGLYLLFGPLADGVRTVGAVPSVLPSFAWPPFGLAEISLLASAAVAIALVGLLEAMSVARGIALKSGQVIDSNREFMGQGLSNLVGSFFQCYPGSASFTRSGVNYEAGAETPLSAIFAALFLLLILLVAAPAFAVVPIPAMAGVILLVALRLIQVREIAHILRTSRRETGILAVTFGTGLLVDLEFAIYAGVLLSIALFLRWSAHPIVGIAAPDPSSPRRSFRHAALNGLKECPQLAIMRLHGPLYFGSVEFVRKSLRELHRDRPEQAHVLLIPMTAAETDLPAAELLIEEAERAHVLGGSFNLVAKTPRSRKLLARLGAERALGSDHIFRTKGEAIEELVPRLNPDICASCTARVFLECADRPGGDAAAVTAYGSEKEADLAQVPNAPDSAAATGSGSRGTYERE